MTRELPATSYVVLGLVSVRPASTGYELAAFGERSIGQFFPLARSHVYTELDRLSGLGLLDATEVEQERFPHKRVYEITEAGLDLLVDWLEDSTVPPERQRNLFLARVFFGDRMSPGRIEELLNSYEQVQREQRDRLAGLVEKLADRPQSRYGRATAMFGLAQVQAKLDWIEQVRPVLLEARYEKC